MTDITRQRLQHLCKALVCYLVAIFACSYISVVSTVDVGPTNLDAIWQETCERGLPNLLAFSIPYAFQDHSAKQPTDALGEPDTVTEEGWTIWDAEKYPNYYKVLGEAHMEHSVEAGNIEYSKLDSLGRTQYVAGTLTQKMVQDAKGNREDIPESADPSGWGHNEQVYIPLANGKQYHGYFWNRSHLIADSLGGDAIRQNLICGTRMQNVGANDGKGGMAYIETKVRDYLNSHADCVVYYCATPIYHADEIVPRSVIVDARSCTGEINERIEVFNTALGYTINYMDGTFSKVDE